MPNNLDTKIPIDQNLKSSTGRTVYMCFDPDADDVICPDDIELINRTIEEIRNNRR